jgi:hypothetical protein
MPDETIRAAIGCASQYLTEHPAQARYTDQSATAALEGGLRVRLVYPGGTVWTDLPASVGGGASAPSPG